MTKSYNHFDAFLNDAFNCLNAPANASNYPPYNIVKIDDSTTVLELAVAGFSPEELSVEIEDNILRIRGNVIIESEEENPLTRNYVHRGISRRAFTRKFALHEYMEVQDTNLKDGILTITVMMEIPETKKPKKVEINVL